MALKDTDYLETKVSLTTAHGGNGDYYLQMWLTVNNHYTFTLSAQGKELLESVEHPNTG